jgi:dynein heavy chain, axonemal
MTLASVVVLDVHNRDVVETMLKENVSSKADFTWISQMRYYYKEEKKKVEIDVKCINSV